MKVARQVVRSAETGMLLQDFLASRLGLSRRAAKNLLDARNVCVNRRRVWMAKHALQAGDEVEARVGRSAADSPGKRNIAILYQDDSYLVVDKPSGLLANGAGSVEERLRESLGDPTLLAVHRLDKGTSGCLLIARGEPAFEAILPVFRRRGVKKRYHVIVHGRIGFESTTVTAPVDGEQAVTHFHVVDTNREASHLLATIETGRTHQIRKHLVHIGHPVVGDRSYGTQFGESDATVGVGRQMLHAWLIEFVHPVTSTRLRVQAPLPVDFRGCLQSLKLK